MNDLPAAITTATIWAYWFGVGMMIVRVKRHSRAIPILAPQQPLERFMGMAWIPIVALWMTLPYLTQSATHGAMALPEFATNSAIYRACRWLAALVAVLCLVATARCWARMGKDWRMAVAVGEKTNLITDGPFRRIRHPIYAFSILLMICTLVVVPTLPMLAVAVVHIVLMNIKARNEERHLLATQGESYAQYMQGTGRFLPRYS
ncbi:MAG: isoprenylcysteine carboxylmethyltransferase family protein [Betaproteobacteria bacterium]